MSNSGDIMVSIVCLAYNHEKYIRKTLEGFVMQKTDFAFQAIVHDDASTDGTADIIREFEEKYPDIIKPVYQTENQYSKKARINRNFIYPKCKGKYIAYCEGDDFWSDPMKLQKQVDILEANENCSICHHRVNVIRENGELTEDYFPRYKEMKHGIIPSEEYLSLILYTRTPYFLQFQLSGAMIRARDVMSYTYEDMEYKMIADVGDIPLFLFAGLKGDAYYLDEAMSSYRSGAIGSWNSRNCAAAEKRIKHLETEIAVIRSYDKYSNGIVHEAAEKGISSRQFNIYRAKHDLKGMKSMPEFYNMLGKKAKIKEFLACYFPFVLRVLNK